MTEPQKPEEKLTEEFRTLGRNLVEALRAAWESPERKRLQQEIESGLNDLGSTIRTEVDHINQSPTGQQIKNDVEDIRQRVRSGDAERQARDELLKVLKTANTELQKVVEKISGRSGTPPAGSPPEPPPTV